MTSSDWITISMTLVAVLIGSGVSWAFFRTQLISDQKEISAKISKNEAGIGLILSNLSTIDSIRDAKDLIEIKKTVENIDRNLHASVSSIVSDIKVQQDALASKIQREFDRQSETSVEVVAQSFRNEVSQFVEGEGRQEMLLGNLVQAFMDGLRTMGEYQKVNIINQSENSLQSIENSIKGSIDEVLDEVVDLKEQVLKLPAHSN